MKPIIYIDITDGCQLILVLEWEDAGGADMRPLPKVIKKIPRPRRPARRLNILAQLEKFLVKRGLTVEKLGGLALLEGAGSFSEARLAAAALNALHLDSGVPVLGLDKRVIGADWPAIRLAARKGLAAAGGPIVPIYSGEPNITAPKIKI